jgi:hypothetical protein
MADRHILLIGHKIRGKRTQEAPLGSLAWSASRGLQYHIPKTEIREALRKAIEQRIADHRYYIIAAVRTGPRVSGLSFDRIEGDVPELLRCIAADGFLWKQSHAGYRLTPTYQEGAVGRRRA